MSLSSAPSGSYASDPSGVLEDLDAGWTRHSRFLHGVFESWVIREGLGLRDCRKLVGSGDVVWGRQAPSSPCGRCSHASREANRHRRTPSAAKARSCRSALVDLCSRTSLRCRAGAGILRYLGNPLGYMTAGWSVPQYLHFVAVGGRSSDNHAEHVLTGAGAPSTVSPRLAKMALYGITMAKYNTHK